MTSEELWHFFILSLTCYRQNGSQLEESTLPESTFLKGNLSNLVFSSQKVAAFAKSDLKMV